MTSRLLVVIVHNLRVTVQFQFLVVREYMFNDLRADTDINDVIVHRVILVIREYIMFQ